MPLDPLHQWQLALIFRVEFIITVTLFRFRFLCDLICKLSLLLLLLLVTSSLFHLFGVARLLVLLVHRRCSRLLRLSLGNTFALLAFGASRVRQTIFLFLGLILVKLGEERVEVVFPKFKDMHLEKAVVLVAFVVQLLLELDHSLLSQ